MDDAYVNSMAMRKAPGGSTFSGVLRLLRKQSKTARNGNPFLSVELGDRFGSFQANCFQDSTAFEMLQAASEGSIVKLDGESDFFQERFSPKLRSVTLIDEAEAGRLGVLEQLVETAPEDPALLWADLEAAIEAIERPALRATVRQVLEECGERFRTSAAAISMHHAYRHGLLEHTVHMVRVCRAILPLYPEVDGDLAIAGIILHDMGKIEEYDPSGHPKKTRAGILQGHVVLGYRIARKAALTQRLAPSLVERLEHIILSHQGELAWGAAALAATPEAVFVSMIDNLDAKMGMVQRTLRNAPEGAEFSDFLPGLQSALYLQTPEQ